MNLKVRTIIGAASFLLGTVFTFNVGAISTELHTAVKENDIEKVKTICGEHPEWINEEDSDYLEPLSYALENRDWDTIKYLVEHGADVDRGLSWAVYNNDLEFVKYFAENGADANLGLNYFSFNEDGGDINLVKCLVEHGGNPTNILWSAVESEKVDIVKYLIDSGADVNVTDYYGETLLHSVHNLEIAEYLVEHGAKVGDYPYGFEGCSEDLINYLVEHGAQIEDYALYNAAYSGNMDLTKCLVEHGVNIGEYALCYAAGSGNLDLMKYLIEHGAKFNGYELLYAISHDADDIAKYLVENGADFNAVQSDGRTLFAQIVSYVDTCENEVKEKQREFVKAQEHCNNVKSMVEYLRTKGAHE